MSEYLTPHAHALPSGREGRVVSEYLTPHALALPQAAKGVLCDPEQRARYDRWLASGLAVPYETWAASPAMSTVSLREGPRAERLGIL